MRAVHIFPVGLDREHVLSSWCWCSPTLSDDDEDGPPVYVHDCTDPGGKIWLCTIVDDDEPTND